MSGEPMRTRRTPDRVPGFSAPASQPTGSSPTATESSASLPALDLKAGTHQLNVRVLAPLLGHYKKLVRDLEDDGFDTSLTELMHALLHAGPRTPEQARRAVRQWRRVLDPPD